MKKDLMEKLEVLFWYLGLLSLVLVLFYFGYEIYNYSQETNIRGYSYHQVDFIGLSFRLASGLGGAFFMLLVSSVFQMIVNREEVNFARANRFLNLTCLLKLFSLVFGVIVQLKVYSVIHGPSSGYQLEVLSTDMLPYITSFSKMGMELIYVITIYTLYKHFVGLIEFEAEVV